MLVAISTMFADSRERNSLDQAMRSSLATHQSVRCCCMSMLSKPTQAREMPCDEIKQHVLDHPMARHLPWAMVWSMARHLRPAFPMITAFQSGADQRRPRRVTPVLSQQACQAVVQQMQQRQHARGT